MLPPDVINAINQAETKQRVVYTVSDDENAALKLVYMEWLNQNRRIVLTKAISVVDGSVSKQRRNIEFDRHKNFWCQGYATEIAQGMIDYARSQGAEKVTIYVGQENAASNRVAQKCGGKIVSESTYKKKGTDIIMKDYKYEIVL